MPKRPESPYLNLSDAAALLNVHRSTLHRWINDGGGIGWELKPMKRGPVSIFKRDEVIAEYERVMKGGDV